MKPFLIMGSLLIVLMISVACGNQSPPAATTPAAAPEPTAVTEPAATAPTPAVRSDDTITDTHTLTDTNALTDTNELLIGSVWQWQQFSNPLELLEIPNPEQYTLVFQEDGTLNIQADCNQAIGSYLLDSHMISITVGPMTRAACPPESQSDQMIEYLGQVVIYSITPEDQLLLEMPVDSGTLVFSRSEGAQMSPVPATTPVTGSIDPALLGTIWQWEQFNNAVEVTDIPIPQQYTLMFQDDGNLSVQADCNQAGGTYIADTGSISITMGFMTMAACPPESKSNDFVDYLGQVVIYSITPEGQLLLEMPVDSGTLVFSPLEIVQVEPVEPSQTTPVTPPVAMNTDPALLGTVWQWQQFVSLVAEQEIPTPEQYTLTFQEDGSLNVQADCNQSGGTYIADSGSISITMGFMTMAECGPESLGLELVDYLGQVAVYSFTDDGLLLLELPAANGTLVFGSGAGEQPVEEPSASSIDPALQGTLWQWQKFISPVESRETPTPEQYTLTFQEDGSLVVQADCNQALGTYTAESGAMTITMGPMTLAECGPESLGLELVDYLGQVAVYSLTAEGQLLLELPADSGTLVFGSGAAVQSPADTSGEAPADTNADQALVGPVWQWKQLSTPVEVRDIPNAQQYTLSFQEDGSLNIQADCNQAAGQYTIDTTAFTITPGAITEMACGPESLGNQMIEYLDQVSSYTMTLEGQLLLEMPANDGTLVFEP